VAEPVAVPFRGCRTTVRETWIDYNGHLNDACYAVVLGEANEQMLETLGVSAGYQRSTGCAMYTVEAHLRYLGEAVVGDVLRAETMLVDADTKRLRLHTALRHADGRPVATGEYLYLHVDTSSGHVEPFPFERRGPISRVLAAHSTLERPAHLGAGLGMPTKPAATPSGSA